MFVIDDAGKRKGSDSDSYDEDDGIEGSYIGSEQEDSMEKDLIATSKTPTQVSSLMKVCLSGNFWLVSFFQKADFLAFADILQPKNLQLYN